MTDPRDLLRAWLRQRRELGEQELVLDRLSPSELQALLSGAPPGPAAVERPAARPADRSAEREPSPPGRVEVAPPPSPGEAEVHVRGGAPVP
ncbi:MAG TPA: hypothetical protein VHG93_03760, partial [Longimicrobium sp.]|nr:hypothetical protein [Longimicrobium sp.]